MKRRVFLRNVLVTGSLIMQGRLVRAAFPITDDDVLFRFAVASDPHYGLVNTPYEEFFQVFVDKINDFHSRFPCSFVVVNGDIFHDNPKFLQPAFEALRPVQAPLYVTKGNHDMVSAEVWEKTWGYGENHAFSIGRRGFLLGTTSNEQGKYLCPDIDWFKEQLQKFRRKKEVYIFIHITPRKWTRFGVECPEFHTLIQQHPNVVAVFNGHDHDVDDIKMLGDIPFMFDGHLGGNFGTEYRGFRVVEKLKSGALRTYMMDPDRQIQLSELAVRS